MCVRILQKAGEGFHNLYSSLNMVNDQINEGDTGGHVACMEATRNAHKVLVM